MTWVLVVTNAVGLSLLLAMSLSVPSDCVGLVGDEFDDCVASWSSVAGFATAVFVGLWLIVDVILGVVWFVTWKPRTRDCPQCLLWVDRSETVCPECGHDFAAEGGPPGAA